MFFSLISKLVTLELQCWLSPFYAQPEVEVVNSFEFKLKMSKILNFVLKTASEIYSFLINFMHWQLTIINHLYFGQFTEQGKVLWEKKGS